MEEEKNNPKFGFIVSKVVYRDPSREGRPMVIEICNTVEEALKRLKSPYSKNAMNGKNSVSWQYLYENPAIKGKFNTYYSNHETVAYITTAVIEVTKENARSVKF